MNKPIGISWEELRKEILTPEEIAASNARIRALEGLQQIREEEGYTLHRIKSVNPLPNYKMNLQFEDGVTKVYDVSLLFDKRVAFKRFVDEPELFDIVKIDKGGYGVVWDDELDLSCNELYDNGVTISYKLSHR